MSASVSETYGSAHDPLCDQWYGSHGLPVRHDVDDCSICDLIAKVRTDEQDLMTEDCDCSDCDAPATNTWAKRGYCRSCFQEIMSDKD